jgi:hypothetical protein
MLYFFILDIFSLNNGPAASKDPFTWMNTLYLKSISGRPHSFFNDTGPLALETSDDDDTQKVEHYMNVTLLPHQILIFPTTIYDNMDPGVRDTMRYYDDEELR